MMRAILRRTILAIVAAVSVTLSVEAETRLRIAALHPMTGPQAESGRECADAIAVAAELLRLDFPSFEVVYLDTEGKPDVARLRANKAIDEGAHLLIGTFNSDQTLAVAQVSEQRGIPFVVSIAAVDGLTEQGYKTVFRNFPKSSDSAKQTLALWQELFRLLPQPPKTAVLLHVNNNLGVPRRDWLRKLDEGGGLPFRLLDTVSVDPKARDLSAEVRKALATKADMLIVVSLLHDAMLIRQEMIKQRWKPQLIVSWGPGWYEGPFLKALGKHAEGVMSAVPWGNPQTALSKRFHALFEKKFPGRQLNTNHYYSAEGLLIALDAYKRAGTTNQEKLAEALRETRITEKFTTGSVITFDKHGQNNDVHVSLIQNQDGRTVVILPERVAEGRLRWPLPH